MIYCNYDALQSKLTETYRKLADNETSQQLIRRHRNYYWIGRYLRECVDCFKDRQYICKTAHHILYRFIVYHGINKQFAFESLDNICGPFSTTKDYNVAKNFCSTQGMILEIEYLVEAEDSISWNYVQVPFKYYCIIRREGLFYQFQS